MNYLLFRKINDYKFIVGIYGSRKTAENMRDFIKKTSDRKGSFTIVKKSKVACPMCNEMVSNLTSHGCCRSCQAAYCYMGTV